MKTMAHAAGLPADKRITNHSARKTMMQTLSNANVHPNHIIQISGHKNLQSVNSYSRISEQQHREIHRVLVDPTSSSAVSSYVQQTTLSHTSQIRPNACHTQTTNDIVDWKSSSASFSTLFSGPIYGGVFNINIGRECRSPSRSPEVELSHKRRRINRIMDSSDSSDEN
jgi:hypothetical protein